MQSTGCCELSSAEVSRYLAVLPNIRYLGSAGQFQRVQALVRDLDNLLTPLKTGRVTNGSSCVSVAEFTCRPPPSVSRDARASS